MRRLPSTLCALVAAATLAAATTSAAEPPARPLGGPPIDRLATELALDDTQKAEVQRMFEEHRSRVEADRKQRDEELRQQLATILTAEQLKKLDELQSRRRHGPPPPR